MAGSKQGWIEAPCCACPASLNDVAQKIVEVQPGRIALVPGLRDEHDGVPDLMRGEEVQIFGAVALTGLDSGLFVLPGSHSKWARVENGRITGFRTFMTGEFYALLAQHSVLARSIDASAALDEGVAQTLGGRAYSCVERARAPPHAHHDRSNWAAVAWVWLAEARILVARIAT